LKFVTNRADSFTGYLVSTTTSVSVGDHIANPPPSGGPVDDIAIVRTWRLG
jgi:hypothetical protein